jgi:hypothetical protein
MANTHEYRSSPTREALYAGTTEWGRDGLKGHEAYLAFIKQLGRHAGKYDTYFSCAITNGGYARDESLGYGEKIQLNTDFSLRMADELAEYGEIDLARSVDAVALGKVEGWDQADYLVFFLNVMTRPRGMDEDDFTDAHKSLLLPGKDFDAAVLNNNKLSHDERRPHYSALGKRYLNLTSQFEIDPIDRMVELLDWDMTLGGLVERETAYSLDAQVYRPAIVNYGGIDTFNGIDPTLQAHGKRLTALGASTTAPKETTIKLVQISE